MDLLWIHGRLSVTAALFTLVLAVWAVAYLLRGRGPGSNYFGAVMVGEVVLMTQAGLGVVLLLKQGMDQARPVHLLYGSLAVLIWPFLLTYTREADERRTALLFAAGSWFLWGLVTRAAQTSHPF